MGHRREVDSIGGGAGNENPTLTRFFQRNKERLAKKRTVDSTGGPRDDNHRNVELHRASQEWQEASAG